MADTLLSESEKSYILNGIQENIRVDGRCCNDFREMVLETSVVSNTNGSARLQLSNTDVLVGIKAELESPDDKHPDRGRMEIFVDCSANADPEFEGRGGEELASEISSLLMRTYMSSSSCFNLKDLCIHRGMYCWLLNIDILVLEYGGNLLDAVSIAVKAALHNTRIPKVSVMSDEDGTTEVDVSDDPYAFSTLNVQHLPCLITVSRIGHSFIVDASVEEEQCAKAAVTFGITDDGNIITTRKSRSGSLHAESLIDATNTATSIGVKMNKILMKILKHESSIDDKRKIGFLR